ncbi:variable surface protein Vir7-like [Plasmodium vivax]|uniref:Variable surface protein Vir7-like n=1 Tax=Plasmodium vivax (strain Salvador I) TaxID=126793 RepID=A5KD96_PLAVS|nr:variable surface protein Vir7-like [Plasmodium vivax]EDL42673.1 variable surface protein Vir7-like [Plasmodium vivax]|eukprot:XP_001612466.1 variable surface protein Vir7-like [Plasmodium vivax Sal-1]
MPEETSDTYYNYDDYIHFKSKFEDQDSVSIDIEIIKRNSVIDTINEHVRDALTHQCHKLKEFLLYIDSNDKNNLTKCCSYINYHLTNKIQGSVYKQKEDTFAHFKKFLQYDPELKSNVCTSQMKYLDDGIYKKMKLLYNLYDSYEVLNYKIDSKNDTHFCTEFNDLFTDYSKIIDAYKISDSKFLFMELKNIKCLIEKNKLMSKRNCEKKISDLTLPKEGDGDFLKPCKEIDEGEQPKNRVSEQVITGVSGQEGTEPLAQHKTDRAPEEITGELAEQGKRLIVNGREELSSEMHPSSSGTYPDVGFQEMRSMEAPPEDSPPTVTSKTIATTASVAAIFVPSYLMYKVNMIMIEKLNFTPTRSLINKLLGRKTNIGYNNIRESDLMDNFPHTEHFNYERNKYNISYRPA